MINTLGDSVLLVLLSVVLSLWWVILLTTNMGKPYQDVNFLMKFISRQLSYYLILRQFIWQANMWCTWSQTLNPYSSMSPWNITTKMNIQAGVCVLPKNWYARENSKSRKCGTLFWYKSTVKLKFELKLSTRFCQT